MLVISVSLRFIVLERVILYMPKLEFCGYLTDDVFTMRLIKINTAHPCNDFHLLCESIWDINTLLKEIYKSNKR